MRFATVHGFGVLQEGQSLSQEGQSLPTYDGSHHDARWHRKVHPKAGG